MENVGHIANDKYNEQIKNFINSADQYTLRKVMEYGKYKKTRDLAIKRYVWKNASKYELQCIKENSKDKEAKKIAIRFLIKFND